MPLGLYVDQPQHVMLKAYDEAPLGTREVRFRTELAAIKHGTDFHMFSGVSPIERQRFDPQRRLFVPQPEGVPFSAQPRFIGNTAVGIVTEVGTDVAQFQVGDRVYTYAAIQESVTRHEDQIRLVPTGMSPEDAVCVDPALYAYALIRDARTMLGDDVVTFGLGAIGLFVAQMVVRSGCLHAIAVDPISRRRMLAAGYGLDAVLDPREEDIGTAVRRWLPQGADIALEASGHYRALADAMRAVGRCARIATLGYYHGKDSELTLGAEWLHNRLELVCSMPVWDNPMRDYPRWDEARLHDTVEALFVRGDLSSEGIVDPVVSLEAQPEAFLAAYHDPSSAVKLAVRMAA